MYLCLGATGSRRRKKRGPGYQKKSIGRGQIDGLATESSQTVCRVNVPSARRERRHRLARDSQHSRQGRLHSADHPVQHRKHFARNAEADDEVREQCGMGIRKGILFALFLFK